MGNFLHKPFPSIRSAFTREETTEMLSRTNMALHTTRPALEELPFEKWLQRKERWMELRSTAFQSLVGILSHFSHDTDVTAAYASETALVSTFHVMVPWAAMENPTRYVESLRNCLVELLDAPDVNEPRVQLICECAQLCFENLLYPCSVLPHLAQSYKSAVTVLQLYDIAARCGSNYQDFQLHVRKSTGTSMPGKMMQKLHTHLRTDLQFLYLIAYTLHPTHFCTKTPESATAASTTTTASTDENNQQPTLQSIGHL